MSAPSNALQLSTSFLFLRKCIGLIGFFLPIVLLIGYIMFQSVGMLDSISAYYYSVMGNVFVGILCALGVFLICYRYECPDDILTTIAGICAICVALFPTAPQKGATGQQTVIGMFHWAFAGGFFMISAIFTFVLFRKKSQTPTPRKLQRNVVYLICGYVILGCLPLAYLAQQLPCIAWLHSIHPVFWLEAIPLWAFGVAWFVKGETILKDG